MAELKEVKEAFETLQKEVETLRKTDAARLESLESRKEVPSDLEGKLTAMQDAVTAADEKHTKLTEELADTNVKLSKLNALEEEVEGKADALEHTKSFLHFMRKGEGNGEVIAKLEELQEKTMFAASDPDGGYAIPMGATRAIVELIRETSPIRQVANVETIGGEDYKFLIDIDDLDCGWVSERAERPNTGTPKMQQGTIPAHELYANPRATQKMLDDAGFDVEGWLNRKVSSKFSRVENTAFVLGTGIGMPRGFLTYDAGTSWGQIERIASGDANLLTPDGLILLQNSLKAEYSNRAQWMMKRQTVAAVRLFKDTTGQYLWQPGIKAGEPATLLGDPIVRAADMPAVGAGVLPVAYGDFMESYTIVDRWAIRVLRDPYSNKPYVEFYTTKRVGGDMVNFDSLKLQVVGA